MFFWKEGGGGVKRGKVSGLEKVREVNGGCGGEVRDSFA